MEYTSRLPQLTINGTDVSAGLISVKAGYLRLQQETSPHTVMEIELNGACGQDMDPRYNPLWQAYSLVELSFAKSTEVLARSPIGGRARIQSAEPKYYGKTSIVPEGIVLSCLCDIGYSKDPSMFATTGSIRHNNGESTQILLNRYWETKGLQITTVAGDVVFAPAGNQTGMTLIWTSQQDNVADHVHQIVTCNAPNAGDFPFFWQDNQGRLRLVKTNLTNPQVWRTYQVENLPDTPRPDESVKDQLPGRVRGHSVRDLYTPLTTDTVTTRGPRLIQISTRTPDGDTTDTVYEPEQTVIQGSTSTSLILSRTSSLTKSWNSAIPSNPSDPNGPTVQLFASSIARESRLAATIDTKTTPPNRSLIPSEVVEQTVTYSSKQVPDTETVYTQKAAGLTDNTKVAPTLLIPYENSVTRWQETGNGKYSSSQTVTSYIDAKLSGSANTITNTSNAQVPQAETRPSGMDVSQQQLFAETPVQAFTDETITGAIDVTGSGTLTGTITYFNGSYRMVPNVGQPYTGNGVITNVTGALDGTGRFIGNGTWVGTRRPLRNLTIDYQNYPRDWYALKRVTELTATLIYASHYGATFSIPIDDAMFDNGGLMPGRCVRINTWLGYPAGAWNNTSRYYDLQTVTQGGIVYMAMGAIAPNTPPATNPTKWKRLYDDLYVLTEEALEWDRQKFKLTVSGLWIGKVSATASLTTTSFQPSVTPTQTYLGGSGFVLVDNAGNHLLGF